MALLGMVCTPLLLVGCATGTAADQAAREGDRPTPAPRLSVIDGIVDPLVEITDRDDDRFVAEHVRPLVAERGRGTIRYDFDPPGGVTSVRVYVACSPESTFRVEVGKGFSGPCSGLFQNYADVPLTGADHLDVALPPSTRFSLLVIATPSQ